MIIYQVLLTMPDNSQLIAEKILTSRNDTAKESTGVETLQFCEFAPGFRFNHPHIGSVG